MTDLAVLVPKLAGARVAVVGDVMLDRFVYGEVERVSPEAPIPVLRITHESTMLGGAGNVARNLQAIGAASHIVSVVGDDEAGREIDALCRRDGIAANLSTEAGRRTTVKTRYIAGGQQLLRTDLETEAKIVSLGAIPAADAVVISDYGKGVVTPELVRQLVAAKAPVVVDPKGADWSRYRGATLITPNRRELAEASRLAAGTDAEIVAAARHMIASTGIASVLATRGADGMTLVTAREATHLPAQAREVFDVSGAGDTVVAVLAAGIAAGIAPAAAAQIANVAAGIVVGRSGTAVAYAEEIVAALREGGGTKLVGRAQALERIADWRRRGLKVGFTNGCFDLIHPGHVSLLAQARAACDRLVVALNSDASVTRLKGKGRPVQDQAARAAVLSSLADVDLVVAFGDEKRENDTPIVLIEAIKPDVLVKGADYTEDKVVGADIVRSYGGKVLLAELTPGQSTTATIARMGR
jgi:D-beta-D-heptose 7-phosphate kinase/D-beta-D-heptose 1-phosphate adenosyltransferase